MECTLWYGLKVACGGLSVFKDSGHRICQDLIKFNARGCKARPESSPRLPKPVCSPIAF